MPTSGVQLFAHAHCKKPTPSHSPQTKPPSNPSFTATVTKNQSGTPSKPIPVSVEVKVDVTSGGHDHGETVIENVTYKRPKGTLSTTSGNTSFPVTFTATDVSGTHTITAKCDQCANKTASAEVTVKVEGLETIPTSTFYKFVGANDKHSKNHFLKPEAANYLLAIAIYYKTQSEFQEVRDPQTQLVVVPHPLLHVNDASLVDGGKFDIYGSWVGAHEEHKVGKSVDIRMNEINRINGGAIPWEHFDKFEYFLNEVIHKGSAKEKFIFECTPNARKTKKNPNPIQHNRTRDNLCVSEADNSEDTFRHFHLRLLGD